MFPKYIEDLIENFKKLPGIGQKSAERMVFSIIDGFEKEDYEDFSNSLLSVSQNIKYCSLCNAISDDDICAICSDKTRNSDILMVVESAKDVFLLEKIGNFDGYYYVLGGLINPFEGIGPDDIHMDGLINRVKSDKVKELVFVTKSCVEADTTILYIKKLLADTDVVVSRIASGVPVGADMDYVDSLTLESALNNRKEVLD